MLQNAFNLILQLRGIDIVIKRQSDLSTHTVKAAQSFYYRKPVVDENIVGQGREYVISSKSINFALKRGDTVIISNDEYYSIIEVKELRGFKDVLGYRVTLE